MSTRRLICLALIFAPDPKGALAPQRDKVQGVVGWNLDPFASEFGGVDPLAFVPDVWDVLVDDTFSSAGYLVLYDATLEDDGTFTVASDFFSIIGAAPHTWAGWPIPGEPLPPPPPPP
jgi:hypothetical protein